MEYEVKTHPIMEGSVGFTLVDLIYHYEYAVDNRYLDLHLEKDGKCRRLRFLDPKINNIGALHSRTFSSIEIRDIRDWQWGGFGVQAVSLEQDESFEILARCVVDKDEITS